MLAVLFALGSLLCLQLAIADTRLFNGAQRAIFDDDAPSQCLDAFDTTLACDYKVQLLSFDMSRLEFNETDLQNLCTPSCYTSLLELNTTVSSSCGTYDFDFNGAYLSAVQVVDLFIYKYDMSCLADSSGQFCLLVENTWDVRSLNLSGTATWPTYTNKSFPNFDLDSDGSPLKDFDGNFVDMSDPRPVFTDYGLNLSMAGQDYYQQGIPLDWEGHGWHEVLEYDEYPLEIQCSECFLGQYRHGIESIWGEGYDEVSDQVWNNVQRNCNLDWQLKPANNMSTWTYSAGPLTWTHTVICDQKFEYQPQSGSPSITTNQLASMYRVPTAALLNLNEISRMVASPGSYCAPESCDIAIVNVTTSAVNLVALYDNITETQFWTWNVYMEAKNLIAGDVVCVGPPGGAYVPMSWPASSSSAASTSTASVLISTTTASMTIMSTVTTLSAFSSTNSASTLTTLFPASLSAA
ncbi:hypothetical protein LTR17_005532 [Elasticomyces elasticus]|nr:hypothetical protein LTR17_005532 [Elasticomyces elasticus]